MRKQIPTTAQRHDLRRTANGCGVVPNCSYDGLSGSLNSGSRRPRTAGLPEKSRAIRGVSAGTAAAAFVCLLLCGADRPDSAVSKLQEGLEHFRNSDFTAARKSFQEASVLAPADPLITYDEACAAMAAGDSEQARKLFQQVSLTGNTVAKLRSHYNLGCLDADSARQKLGADPAAAVGEVREESLQLLLSAVREYRNVLRLQPNHPDARHNLELIRSFIKHIQSQWDERDRQRARDELDLLQFLKKTETDQDDLQQRTQTTAAEPESWSRRKVLLELGTAQHALQQELDTLRQKLIAELQQSAPGNPPAPGTDDDAAGRQRAARAEAEKLLLQLIADAGRRMQDAATELNQQNTKSAVTAQQEARRDLHNLYLAIAPYTDLLSRGIDVQQQFVPEAPQSAETKADVDADAAATTNAVRADADGKHAGSSDDANSAATGTTVAESPDVDHREPAWQARLTDYAAMLSLKAEADLPGVQQQLDSLPPAVPEAPKHGASAPASSTPESPVADETPNPADASKADEPPQPPDTSGERKETQEQTSVSPDEQTSPETDAIEQQRLQLTGLLESMNRAIKLAPQAEQHSSAAASLLKKADALEADEEQRETLRLLKEIAEPLQHENPQENDAAQDQQQQGQQQDQQQDQQQQSGDNSEEQDSQQNNSGDSSPQKPEQQQKSPDDDNSTDRNSPDRDSSKQQQQKDRAESVLQQAREREQQHRDLEKQIRAILGRRFPVDRDW
ncbi:MAG: hypothetical protein KDA89_01795 [Planctomycetaceae bacterium]|nr:hypothetical protein [Planctomycetaceae bacterium]